MCSVRKVFSLNGRKLNKWNPGHMVKGQRVMDEKLRDMDIVLEVHDSRIPISGRNAEFRERFTAAKPHLLLLNKMDLVDTRYNNQVEKFLMRNQGISKVMYTDLSAHGGATSHRGVLPQILQLASSCDRFHRSDSADINVMVIGIPNVGKSSFINRIRGRFKMKQPATVAAYAGVTRAVQERIKLAGHPTVYIWDTPGILTPKFTSIESYMKLALMACLDDSVIGHELIADYGLYWLNKNDKLSYVNHYSMKEATDDITKLLLEICILKSYFYRPKPTAPFSPDFHKAALRFLADFRTGALGKFMLDCDLLPGVS